MSDDAPSAFPPQTIEAFLRFCAGEWLALRSRFALTDAPLADAVLTDGAEGESDETEGGEAWHSSERGELVVTYLEPTAPDQPGGLSVGPKGEVPRQLLFDGEGSFAAGDQRGRWQLWPDGSLELTLNTGRSTVRERIWFTKANLRLRSCLEQPADGGAGRASFSSEIRRLSHPAEPPAA